MWMVGDNEGGDFNMVDHSFSGRKLMPLMPRSITSLNTAPPTTTLSLTHPHGNHFPSQYDYHHLGIYIISSPLVSVNVHLLCSSFSNVLFLSEQNKREQFNGTAPAVVSSRWNPTREQLRALEELYRRGTRTPSAEQIQHITAQLRRFGNIEGKNVFYWFQNHKARERQKRRRQMESDAETPEKKDSGDMTPSYHSQLIHNHLFIIMQFCLLRSVLIICVDFSFSCSDCLLMSSCVVLFFSLSTAASRTEFEVKQTKNWTPSTNCSTIAEV